MKKLNIAVLVSGGGTNLQALIDNEIAENASAGVSDQGCSYHIVCVISSTKNAYAIERAHNANIPTEIASPFSVMGENVARQATMEEKRIATSDKILELCKSYNADAIVLAGYLSVLTGDIVKAYKNKIINLHPALLPKFGGVGMWGHNVHEAVLAAGEKESGCTIHLVDDGCDTGKILIQKKVPVMPGDTPDSLYARIAPNEHEAIIEGVKWLSENI
ncbi:MAG: phosphoribosylglycinamide formyltransferase [Treponemataceae bacterium]|nr:phosphoribosylglycinamide formyltransferase [Treponemataceae bacterium]